MASHKLTLDAGDGSEAYTFTGISFADCVATLFSTIRDVPEQYVCGQIFDALKEIAEHEDLDEDESVEITGTSWDMINRIEITYTRIV